MNTYEQSLELHRKSGGKLATELKVSLENKNDLSLAYSPGVAEPCRKIADNPDSVYDYTIKKNTVAVITDGSAVLGLGNIGAKASLPVMEGKCALLKKFADVDAFPIALDTQDTNEIIETVRRIAPVFGGINLEDISAPRCFEIEEALQNLGIPVFHDDQHGTAIVVAAGLLNALKVTGKNISETKVVIAGAGAAGIAISRLLTHPEFGVKNLCLVDSKGLTTGRTDLNPYKQLVADSATCDISGDLAAGLTGAHVFIGVSQPGIVTEEMIKSMNADPIIFALSNPTPEIMPDLAKQAGAAVVATGRSDFPNQINNVLVFPGLFRGALDARVSRITNDHKVKAAFALSSMIENPTADSIIPDPFMEGVSDAIASIFS